MVSRPCWKNSMLMCKCQCVHSFACHTKIGQRASEGLQLINTEVLLEEAERVGKFAN